MILTTHTFIYPYVILTGPCKNRSTAISNLFSSAVSEENVEVLS